MYYRSGSYYGPPVTVFYPGYYSNVTHYPPINTNNITRIPNEYEIYTPQFPPVDPTQFNISAKSMQVLMIDASIVLKEIANSKDYAYKVMSAAQESHLEEVEKLIKSTGIKSNIDATFNPDGINLEFSPAKGQPECCKLNIALRWR